MTTPPTPPPPMAYPPAYPPAGPAWGQPWPVAPRPLPQPPGATTGLVLGIVALAGGLVLLLPLVVAPVAWYLGASSQRTAERDPAQWRTGGAARAATILGMIGSGILAFVTIVAAVLATLAWVTISTPSPY